MAEEQSLIGGPQSRLPVRVGSAKSPVLQHTNHSAFTASRGRSRRRAWMTKHMRSDQPELVLGQATTFAPFTAAEVAKVRELSERLGKNAYLAFSTFSRQFRSTNVD